MSIDIVIYACFFMGLTIVKSLHLDAKKNDSDLVLLTVATLAAAYFYTSRSLPSTDAIMYFESYLVVDDYSDYNWGYVFYIYQKFLTKFSLDFNAYTKISIILFLAIFSYTINIVSPKNHASIVFLFFIHSFEFFDLTTNVFRQATSGIAILLAFSFMQKNSRAIFFILLSMIAYAIHWSALIIVLQIAASTIIYKNKKIILVIAVFLFFSINISVLTGQGLGATADQIQNIIAAFGLDEIIQQNKIDAYIGGAVDGALFSELSILGRLKSVILYTSTLALIIYAEKKYGLLSNGVVAKTSSAYIVLLIYSYILIDSTWFFRNFYWAFLLIPPTIINIVALIPNNKIPNKYLLTSLFYMAIGLIALWRNPILSAASPKIF